MARSVPPFFEANHAAPGPDPDGNRVIGTDLGRLIVVTTASVVARDGDRKTPDVFVNSSEAAFEATISDLGEWYSADLSDDEAIGHVRALRRRLELADPAALGDGCWWPVVLEQVEDGLL